MATATYILCTLTSAFCALLLYAAYRRSRSRLLLMSGLCFGVLTLTNALVLLDKAVLPAIDLLPLRLLTQLVALSMLLIGLLWREE